MLKKAQNHGRAAFRGKFVDIIQRNIGFYWLKERKQKYFQSN